MPSGEDCRKADCLLKILKGKNVFIAGSQKNAGKTTFLNYALKTLGCGPDKCCRGITSIGIDGEETDGIFGNAKPRITAEAGDLFICSEKALENGGIQYGIINVYPYKTAIGRPVLARALRRGEIEISGPENNDQLAGMISDMRAAGADTVFIDGAADRITHSGISPLNMQGENADPESGVLAYVAKIEPENFNSAVSAIKILAAASNCRTSADLSADIPDSDIIKIAGAATEIKTERAVSRFFSSGEKKKCIIVFDSPSSVFLPWMSWRQLCTKSEIVFETKPKKIILAINLYNVNRADFEKKLISPGSCVLFYNPYEA